MLAKLKSISKIQLLAVLLIIIGLGVAIRFGVGSFRSYQAMEYARKYHFDGGNPDPALIRPWMNIRYIAVAYTVPQEYLLKELGLPLVPENTMTPLVTLNQKFDFGAVDGHPVIVDRVREGIARYQANPVPTGLQRNGVRTWMSFQYVANSTGIPVEVLFEKTGIPMDGNAYLVLDHLSAEVRYPGGPRELAKALQQVVDSYQPKP